MFTVKSCIDEETGEVKEFKNISCLRLRKHHSYFFFIIFHLKTFHVYG